MSALSRNAAAIARGTAVGFALLLVLQAGTLAWIVVAAPSDATAARAAEAVSGLGDERWTFLARLTLGTSAAGAVLGFAQALLRRVALERERCRLGRIGRDVLFTAAALAVHVLGRTCNAPALLAPALPLPASLVAIFVAHVAPEAVYGALLLVALAALTGGLLVRRRARVSVAPLALLSTLVAVAFLLVPSGCSRARVRVADRQKRPDIVILASDSVRSDHLSSLGYTLPTTPNLDQLVHDGTTFDRTLAALAMTTPSWTSILTGRYPHGHGIRHMFPDERLRPASLDALPKIAAENGYRTVVLSDYAGDFFPLFDFGFARAQVPPPLNARTVFQQAILSRDALALALLEPLPDALRMSGFRYLPNAADAERLADEALDELDADPRPLFLVVFFSTTHVPFASRAPYYDRFASPTYGGEHRFSYNLLSLADLGKAGAALAPRDVAQVVGLYDGALSSVDAAIGRILDGIDQRGGRDSTLVLFFADHGENLFEPGQTTLHGRWFRGGDEASRVPLLVRGPGIAAGYREGQPVSLVDLAPTLTQALGWRPLANVEGRSLVAGLQGLALPPAPVFAETGAWLDGPPDPDGIPTPPLVDLLTLDPRDDGQLIVKPELEDVLVTAKYRAIWSGTNKLVYLPTPTGVRFALFDLASDPHQRRELDAKSPEGQRLTRTLLDWMARDPEREIDGRLHVVRRGI